MDSILLDDCNQLEFRCPYGPSEYRFSATQYGPAPELSDIQKQAIAEQWVRWHHKKEESRG